MDDLKGETKASTTAVGRNGLLNETALERGSLRSTRARTRRSMLASIQLTVSGKPSPTSHPSLSLGGGAGSSPFHGDDDEHFDNASTSNERGHAAERLSTQDTGCVLAGGPSILAAREKGAVRPDRDVRSYLIHLRDERMLAPSTRNIAVQTTLLLHIHVPSGLEGLGLRARESPPEAAQCLES